ncbi:hypothetical protein BDY21DRAFT_344431 [Lineolata rhizophorae]|uniref:Cytochrome b/b6 N-terminal region profile domain-containing protein n=1 Tax=Lineolata rhizophorae TaxID=578093 RepID=A0A6A6P0W4_9PEZI|nr:hypothetical protein BDY21DRAFT_344431 [Lineolata rhizophorae]
MKFFVGTIVTLTTVGGSFGLAIPETEVARRQGKTHDLMGTTTPLFSKDLLDQHFSSLSAIPGLCRFLPFHFTVVILQPIPVIEGQIAV